MECKKYVFKSPVFGSVYCEALTEERDNRVYFGPDGAYHLYNRDKDDGILEDIISELAEDLKEYVADGLKDIVVSALFGKFHLEDEKLYLLTEVCVKRTLSDEELYVLRSWITGQMSDVWGESLENWEVFIETINTTVPVFDSHLCIFYEDEHEAIAYYNYEAYQYGSEWSLELLRVDTVDIDVPEEVSLGQVVELSILKIPHRIRTIYTMPSVAHFKAFSKNEFKDTEFEKVLTEVEESNPNEVYLVKDIYLDEDEEESHYVIRPSIGCWVNRGYILRSNYNFGGYDRHAFASQEEIILEMMK